MNLEVIKSTRFTAAQLASAVESLPHQSSDASRKIAPLVAAAIRKGNLDYDALSPHTDSHNTLLDVLSTSMDEPPSAIRLRGAVNLLVEACTLLARESGDAEGDAPDACVALAREPGELGETAADGYSDGPGASLVWGGMAGEDDDGSVARRSSTTASETRQPQGTFSVGTRPKKATSASFFFDGIGFTPLGRSPERRDLTSELLSDGQTDLTLQYATGHSLTHDGNTIGTVVRRVAESAHSAVYELRKPDGTTCAAKVVREDMRGDRRIEQEKKLALEVSLGFALGRSALLTSVIGLIAPRPGVATTAKGYVLLRDFAESGTLESIMKGSDENYYSSGELYTEDGVETWPLMSLTLQIYLGLAHIHGRGIIHQVSGSEVVSLTMNEQL